MTPFGARVRELRAARAMTLSEMAGRLGVSPAYLSALEHGKRGKPPFALMQGIIHVLGVIWDDADDLVRLADLSHPRVVIDTAGLEPEATRLANHLASVIGELTPEAIGQLQATLDAAATGGTKLGTKPGQ
jgi:transcriptional regulator with XRE-family HTH domain